MALSTFIRWCWV